MEFHGATSGHLAKSEGEGTCQECGRTILLDENGLVGIHSSDNPELPCPGSECEPKGRFMAMAREVTISNTALEVQ